MVHRRIPPAAKNWDRDKMQQHLKETATVKFQTSLDAWTQSPETCEEYEQAMKAADPDRLWGLLNARISDIA
eukprot:9943588-Heterocapsa_arctica.AAC.1